MKSRRLALFAVLVLSAATLLAQPRGRGFGGGYNRMYDPGTVQTIAGTITAVDRATSGARPMAGGVHLTVHTNANQTFTVALGPSWYVDELKTTFAAGSVIEVKGSLVKMNGADILLAAEVKKGTDTVVLRDANGVPAWAGARCR